MNKLITKIVGAALGLTMAVGVGVGFGDGASKEAVPVSAAEQSVSFDLTSTGTSLRTTKSADLIKYESGSVYFSIIKGTGTNANNYCPGGSTNNSTQTRVYNGNSVEFGVGSSYVVTKIEVTATSASSFGGLNQVVNYSPTPTISTAGNTTTVTFASAVQAATVTAKTTATGRLTGIKIYYDEPASDPTIALDKSEVTVGVGYSATFTVTTANLSSNFSITGGDGSYFTTSYTPASSDGNHTVTLTGVAATASPITLTVSSTGATSQTIDVSVEEPLVYEKVTAVSSLKVGSEIIIGTTDGSYVLGQYISGNNCPALENTPDGSGNLISTTLPEGYALFTIGGESGAWTLTDQDDAVYYGTRNNNYLKSGSDDTWTISISSGTATITSATSSRSIKKNSSLPAFATYASGQTDVSIYMVPSTDPGIEVLVTGSQSLGVGETATLAATKLNGATGTVNWATSNSSILSLSATTGDSVTVTAGSTLGSATITTSLTGCDDVETVFTVRRGSATEPYTVAQAMTAIDGSDSGAKTGVYTAGIISQVDSLNADNSITYWFSDNGTTTNQMEAYKGLGLNSATFSSVDDLQVGDEVVVYGNLTKYGSTYEYAAGNHLYSHNRPVVELATITSIEGSLSAKAGDAAWDLSGLTVKGTYTGSATIVDVTALVDLTTTDVPGTPAETTTRNVSITATGKADSLITLTQNVSGTITVDSGLVTAGNYRIMATRDSVTYYLKEEGTSSAPSAVTNFWEATVFTFTLVADDTYTISHGENYLYCTATNNGVRFGSTSTATEERWTISTGESTLDGSYNLYSAKGSRYLSLYNATDWRGYTSATGTNRKENTDLQAFNATQFATEFLSTYTAGCNADGGYDSENMKWSTASAQFGYLASADQTTLRGATASESGSNVEQAVARYDYIVGKYGIATFEDFMTRNPAALSSSKILPSIVGESGTTVSVIVIITMVSLTAIGGYFFIRKRKEQ